ncbi:Na+/H+ antiporter [Asticcacaulis sp. 201]|uniref:Na+/H+ antiporter n=1 Tax=Asticcacaulis sp. 201 TaxID=3028787 RepID=UPI002916D777|nr:Na+/H+ antiporter [Asticcacaulis sp. 201]MDV6330805.1 Na+/H+ antiporter [Asticcacaulis sp. 201]
METISIILILLFAVVVSGLINRVLPFNLPLPLVQIGLGALMATVLTVGVELDPEIFFLLFLPPLLFLDGWRIPKEGVFRDISTILELALGLVIFTVIGIGFFIFWLIPDMPLPVAFALAAVLAPTDPIAVSAIAARVPIPKRLMHILEGEALLNDASGLVCLRLAIAAALTGAFSLVGAVTTFAWLAIGGLGIGFAVSWCAGRGKHWISKRFGSDPGSFILISLLIPFAAYLLAEHFHCSGILAAVAAGFTMSFVENPASSPAIGRIRRDVVWDMVQFVANGAIFILLGEQLPKILAGAMDTARQIGHPEPWWLPLDVVIITAVLISARFLWVWISLRFTMFRARKRGETPQRPHLRLVAATSLAGVKGAITLAGILTLPLALTDGTAFPTRDLAIFLAAGVIVLSLIIASIGLPLVLKNLSVPAETSESEEDIARVAAAEAAIKAIEEAQHTLAVGRADADIYAQAGLRVMARYRHRIDAVIVTLDNPESSRHLRQVERELLKVGLVAERREIVRLGDEGRVGSEAVKKLIREADLSEARMMS